MLSLLFFRDIYSLLYRVKIEEDKDMKEIKETLKAILVVLLILGVLGSCLIVGSVWGFLAWLF